MLTGRRALAARARQRGRRSDPARSRATARAHPDRRGAERDPDAGVHPAPAATDRDTIWATSSSSGRCTAPERFAFNEFLTRNGHPFHYVDLDRDRDAQEMLDRFQIERRGHSGRDLLRQSRAAQSHECARLPTVSASTTRSIPRASSISSSSAPARRDWPRPFTVRPKGSMSCVLESNLPGGQAGSSSRIENYLGFPTGISGLDLTGRAYAQALKFGAQVLMARGATRLACDGKRYTVDIGDGPPVAARAVIIASGAEYRKPPLVNLSTVRRRRHLLRRDADGGAAVRRRGRRDRRRRQFRGTGGRLSRVDRRAGSTCWSADPAWPTRCRGI